MFSPLVSFHLWKNTISCIFEWIKLNRIHPYKWNRINEIIHRSNYRSSVKSVNRVLWHVYLPPCVFPRSWRHVSRKMHFTRGEIFVFFAEPRIGLRFENIIKPKSRKRPSSISIIGRRWRVTRTSFEEKTWRAIYEPVVRRKNNSAGRLIEIRVYVVSLQRKRKRGKEREAE